ncbi:GtrA family protein [Actinobacteria bacterium OK074]|nr:GtrA family protein [Actinobacteria bacterium OK074]
MNSLLSSKPQAVCEPQRAMRTEGTTVDTAAGTTAPAAPGPFASFIRFVVCGGGIGVLSSLAVPMVALLMPWAVANAVITVVSTILCTELHSRFTFGTGRSAGWRQHWQSAGSATAAYAVTTAAIFVLHLIQSSPGMLTEQIVYLSASGLAGIGRFVILRVFVFATGRKRVGTATEQRDSVAAPATATVQIAAPATTMVQIAAPATTMVQIAAPALVPALTSAQALTPALASPALLNTAPARTSESAPLPLLPLLPQLPPLAPVLIPAPANVRTAAGHRHRSRRHLSPRKTAALAY